MLKGYSLFFSIILFSVFNLFHLEVTAQSILEAEDAYYSSGKVDTQHVGFTGTGFVDTDNAVGVYIEWFLNLNSAASD
ncbi:MAG: hypothetical protein KDE26_29235, partial [Bacteroidetes bacterium]|nr:hypothetical protein [Bacteroidota bacterium]